MKKLNVKKILIMVVLSTMLISTVAMAVQDPGDPPRPCIINTGF